MNAQARTRCSPKAQAIRWAAAMETNVVLNETRLTRQSSGGSLTRCRRSVRRTAFTLEAYPSAGGALYTRPGRLFAGHPNADAYPAGVDLPQQRQYDYNCAGSKRDHANGDPLNGAQRIVEVVAECQEPAYVLGDSSKRFHALILPSDPLPDPASCAQQSDCSAGVEEDEWSRTRPTLQPT